MSKDAKNQIPSNPDDLKAIRNKLEEISAQQQMIKDRQESIKEIKQDIKDGFDWDNSFITKMVKAIDDETYVEMTSENNLFELARETIFGDAGLPDDNEKVVEDDCDQ